MDATTFAAMRLAQQRFADLDRENARLVALAERRRALAERRPASDPAANSAARVATPLEPAAPPTPAEKPTAFALAGPSS